LNIINDKKILLNIKMVLLKTLFVSIFTAATAYDWTRETIKVTKNGGLLISDCEFGTNQTADKNYIEFIHSKGFMCSGTCYLKADNINCNETPDIENKCTELGGNYFRQACYEKWEDITTYPN
jgi:hypothetical protein